MLQLNKSLRQYLPGLVITLLALSLTGCQQLSQRAPVVRAPMVPSAPSPYSFPRGGAYSIADPMPDIAPRQPMLRPGHSIPLDPSPSSAPPPPQQLPPAPLLNPDAMPPAPGDPVNSRSSSGDSVSSRSKNLLNRLRNFRSPQSQPSAQMAQQSPPARLSDSDPSSSTNSRSTAGAAGNSSSLPRRQSTLLPASAPDRATPPSIDNDDSDSDSIPPSWRSTAGSSGTNAGIPSRNSQPGDDTVAPARSAPSSLPQFESAPVLLPPGV